MLIYWVKTNAIKRNTKALLGETSRKVGLEVNTEGSKYMVMSHYKHAEEIIIY